MILETLSILLFAKIAWHDIQTQKIRNSDLISVGIILSPIYWRNWPISLLNFTVYLVLYFLSQRKLGEGDLKLSIICALQLSSVLQLMQSVTFTWFIGGVFALFKPRTSIAFAPFMILGTYLAKFYTS
jgi:prepilin signal peptidase PulO-like enzyme (type II secretory pathway)